MAKMRQELRAVARKKRTFFSSPPFYSEFENIPLALNP